MIAYAYLFFLLFFALLGALHALEEVEVQGRRYRAAPVFPALLLLVPAVMMLAFTVPGLGGLVATAVEPTSATIRVQLLQLQPNVTAVTYTSKPPASAVLEPQLPWLYWVYALCAAFFPLGGYYFGYNIAAWLESREMIPLLVRIPAVVFVVEEEVERPKPVEVVAKRRWREGLVFPVEE